MDPVPGHYLGTEIGERWWKRYAKDGYFARGNGVFWQDACSLHFLRSLTRRPLEIPMRDISGFKLDRWHAGRWVGGSRAIKILWQRDGLHLSSGFVLTRREAEARRMIDLLSRLCQEC